MKREILPRRAQLDTALRLDPKNAIALREMGLILFAGRQYDLARRFFVRAVQANPQDRASQGYLGCALMRLNRGRKGRNSSTTPATARGRPASNPHDCDPSALVIEFRNVGKTYRSLLGNSVKAVEEFSLQVVEGEILGIAGPNGAGKTTLIAMMLGYLRPTTGTVEINGLPARTYVERNGIGYLSELIAINPKWRADTALVRYATLAGIPESQIPAHVDAVIEKLGLGEHRDKKVKALSKGNLQRLGLAQALLRDEQILVLDEPTHGLDPVWTQRFRDIVEELRRPDRTILIASHNLDELQRSRIASRSSITDGCSAWSAPATTRLSRRQRGSG